MADDKSPTNLNDRLRRLIVLLSITLLAFTLVDGVRGWMSEEEPSDMVISKGGVEGGKKGTAAIIYESEFGQQPLSLPKDLQEELRGKDIIFLSMSNTHQKILRAAYKRLAGDPALEGINFPPLEEILKHEGTDISLKSIYKLKIYLTGNGPDASDKSKFSDHWYNPKIDRGNAPNEAAKYFKGLRVGLESSRSGAGNGHAMPQFQDVPEDEAEVELPRLNLDLQVEGMERDTAYLAHFIADMSCPNHVTGMPADLAIDAYNKAEKAPGLGESDIPTYIVYLNEDITGPGYEDAKYGWSHTIVGTYRGLDDWKIHYDNDNGYDWYDPWYWDASILSSHTYFERLYSEYDPANKLDGYSKDYPYISTAKGEGRIKEFTKNIAKTTWNNFETWIGGEGVGDALDNAITNVYTAWRASFSALRPDAFLVGSRLRVSVENKAIEPAQEVSLEVILGPGYKIKESDDQMGEDRLTVSCGTIVEGTPWEKYFILEPTADAVGQNSWKVRLNVSGNYIETPDLGEASLEKTISDQEIADPALRLEDLPEELGKLLGISGFHIAEVDVQENLETDFGKATGLKKEYSTMFLHKAKFEMDIFEGFMDKDNGETVAARTYPQAIAFAFNDEKNASAFYAQVENKLRESLLSAQADPSGSFEVLEGTYGETSFGIVTSTRALIDEYENPPLAYLKNAFICFKVKNVVSVLPMSWIEGIPEMFQAHCMMAGYGEYVLVKYDGPLNFKDAGLITAKNWSERLMGV